MSDRLFLTIKFRHAEPDVLTLSIDDGSGAIDDAGEISLNEFDGQQQRLLKAANLYANNPSVDWRRRLFEDGAEVYQWFLDSLEREAAHRWKKHLKDAKGFSTGLHLYFPKHRSFPFSLLYTGDPATQDPEDFVGHRFSIVKRQMGVKRLGRVHSALKVNGSRLPICHAYDNNLPHALAENGIFQANPAIELFTPLAHAEVIDVWNPNTRDFSILHISAHLGYDDNRKDQFVTFGDDARIYARQVTRVNPSCEVPPLIFLNICSGGVAHLHDARNFVESLYPTHALGFVTTMAKIPDDFAARFADVFYRRFLEGEGKSIDDAIAFAKGNLVHEHLAALSFSLWEVNPSLKPS